MEINVFQHVMINVLIVMKQTRIVYCVNLGINCIKVLVILIIVPVS